MQSGFTIEVTKGGFNSGIGLKERPKFQYGSSGKPALMDVFSKLPLVNNPFFKKKKRCDTRHQIVDKISRFHHIPLFVPGKTPSKRKPSF